MGEFYFIAGPLCSLISATIACSTLYYLNILNNFDTLREEWLLWWIADICSVIIFVTLFIAFFKFAQNRRNFITIFMSIGMALAYVTYTAGQNWEEERLDLLCDQKVNAAVDTLQQLTMANMAEIKVIDNGNGINEEHIDIILDPFTRIQGNPQISQEGTGLGLAIVNSLIKLHKGTLSIDSKVGVGTTMTIRIPL